MIRWIWLSATTLSTTRDRAKEAAHTALKEGGTPCTTLQWDSKASTSEEEKTDNEIHDILERSSDKDISLDNDSENTFLQQDDKA